MTITRRVWVIYERDTQYSAMFASPDQAEGQQAFDKIDACGWCVAQITTAEDETLDSGGCLYEYRLTRVHPNRGDPA